MAVFTSQTNWKLTSGTFHNVLTFETSLASSDNNDDEVLPLLLHSPSPDSTPCQITINFAKKQEVKQIYVRSTARVYEVYIIPDRKCNGKSEYLATVHCGLSTRDDEPMITKPYINLTSVAAQDLYEATNDFFGTKPCISVTLRLLSLQSKGSVYVDEIYVFGDPIDSEIQENCNENSSSSSLMEVSKTAELSSLNAVRKEEQVVSDDDLKVTPRPSASAIESLKIVDPHEVELKQVKGGSVCPSQVDTFSQTAQIDINCRDIPSKIAEMVSKHLVVPSKVSISQGDCSGGNVERAIEKLMNRIEEICLGFQEKMVMPMSNIEARLQRVEQQLDLLSKKQQNC